MNFDFKLKFEITVVLVGTKERVWTAFVGDAMNCAIDDCVLRSTILLSPTIQCLAVKQRLPTIIC